KSSGTSDVVLLLRPDELLPKVNSPWFSRKKSRFSGKNRLKRVRFTCCSSASTCAKSVLYVRSAVMFCVMLYFASTPKSPLGSLASFGTALLSVVTSPFRYGFTSRLCEGGGASTPTRLA